MSSKLALALTLAVPLVLGGCLNEPIGSRDAGFGEAVKYDNAIQTINPEPVYAANAATQPGSNGEVGQKAVQRYRTDQIKPVQTQETTMGTSGSGSGSGSGPQ